MSNIIEATVTEVHHWTDSLFTIKLTRDPGFRFENGQFAMIGLRVDGKPLMRAYSVVSANYEEHLEFLSIKVPNGPLTSRLQHVQVGDTVLVNRKVTGTLVTANLLPGKNLYLISTGTGLAPFLSIIKDPEVYELFDRVILTHTCRTTNELVYRELIERDLPQNEFFGDVISKKLTYYCSVTREQHERQGRITSLIYTGKLFEDLGEKPFDPAVDRVMICGNPSMLVELSNYLESIGFDEGAGNKPGHFVIEKAFAEAK
ncbi:ferredoxin--NADP reductase [Insolitispirillum peregrinum]|uniref:ferredoxin--NADP reductase n=1 Tax=Insolitispirillum peregrinum TaxID=80876 RepID=UPI00361F7A3F